VALFPLRAGMSVCGVLMLGLIGFPTLASTAQAQPSARVDFARDVQPLLRQRCTSCHGPSQQMAGLRLDRRGDAMRGSTYGTVIGPGNGEASRLYLRVSGTERGVQMPPTGALTAEQIALIKTWIDEGAEWPDALSGDAPPRPVDPGSLRLMERLRAGDGPGFQRELDANPASAKGRGPQGVTPLMYAALYADAPALRALIEAGADPNATNDAGATALFWATDDPAKVRLLLERGASVTVKSLDGRTPLMVAAGRAGSSEVLLLLLDKGADPNVDLDDLTALGEAAYAADPAAMQLLIARGADPTNGAIVSMIQAAEADCVACVQLLLPSLDKASLTAAALAILPPNDDGDELPLLLDAGADVTAKDRQGRSMMMRTISSDTVPQALVQRLTAAGATPFTPAPVGPASPASAASAPAASSAREAVIRALPLLQQTGVTFRRKAGCVSCHNNTLTARTTVEAARAGIPVDETVARGEVAGIAHFLETWRERALQGLGIPGDADTVSYIMLGLADEKHPADAATDAMAHYLKNRQLADGSWRTVAHRPPIESTDITVTALSLRALQLYAPVPMRAQYEEAARRAGRWLAARTPITTEERVSQLLGMRWTGQGDEQIGRAGAALLATQRPDGGWSQLPTLESDSYATGQALVALHDAARVQTSDASYRRGIDFLLRTQQADGTWHVRSRALAIQPLFDIGFPHGNDSWISAAGTNWAATALALAAQPR